MKSSKKMIVKVNNLAKVNVEQIRVKRNKELCAFKKKKFSYPTVRCVGVQTFVRARIYSISTVTFEDLVLK